MKLSEKGCEQRSERGFGRYRGAKTGRTVPLRCPGRPRLTHLRDFSDSFITKFAFWAFSEVRKKVSNITHLGDAQRPPSCNHNRNSSSKKGEVGSHGVFERQALARVCHSVRRCSRHTH